MLLNTEYKYLAFMQHSLIQKNTPCDAIYYDANKDCILKSVEFKHKHYNSPPYHDLISNYLRYNKGDVVYSFESAVNQLEGLRKFHLIQQLDHSTLKSIIYDIKEIKKLFYKLSKDF